MEQNMEGSITTLNSRTFMYPAQSLKSKLQMKIMVKPQPTKIRLLIAQHRTSRMNFSILKILKCNKIWPPSIIVKLQHIRIKIQNIWLIRQKRTQILFWITIRCSCLLSSIFLRTRSSSSKKMASRTWCWTESWSRALLLSGPSSILTSGIPITHLKVRDHSRGDLLREISFR